MSIDTDRSALASGATTIETRLAEVAYRPSGFDYMRIGLSICVLLWHSYCVSYSGFVTDQFWRSPYGYLVTPIVPAFFALSGFLVFGSLERTRNVKRFLALRAIRIYPALVVEVLLSAFILGPIVTSVPLWEYFQTRSFFSYLLNTVGWVHFRLPGVFSDNPMVGTVNVSMWTVPYELECYILLVIVSLVGYLTSRRLAVILFAAATLLVAAWLTIAGIDPTPPGHVAGRLLIICFLAGTLVYRFRDRIPFNPWLALACGVFALVALRYNYAIYFAPLPLAYAVAYLGLQNPARTVIVNSGDYSYGVYLYAAPIQQTVVWALGDNNSWTVNVLIALPIVVGFALFSWHFVEKPFLKVKNIILKAERRP